LGASPNTSPVALHDNGPAFDPDPRKHIRRAFAAVLGVDLCERALDR
jgi:hypothetical protein